LRFGLEEIIIVYVQINLCAKMFGDTTADEAEPVLLLEFERYLVKTVHKHLNSLFTAGKVVQYFCDYLLIATHHHTRVPIHQ